MGFNTKKLIPYFASLVMVPSIVMGVNIISAKASAVSSEVEYTAYEEYYSAPYKIRVHDIDGSVIKYCEINNYYNEMKELKAITEESTEQYNYKINSWEIKADDNEKVVDAYPQYTMEVRKYNYSVIYRAGDKVLDKVNGKWGYGEELEVPFKEFDGYEVKQDSKTSLKITEEENKNVLYVDYVESPKVKVEEKKSHIDNKESVNLPKAEIKEPTQKHNYETVQAIEEKDKTDKEDVEIIYFNEEKQLLVNSRIEISNEVKELSDSEDTIITGIELKERAAEVLESSKQDKRCTKSCIQSMPIARLRRRDY